MTFPPPYDAPGQRDGNGPPRGYRPPPPPGGYGPPPAPPGVPRPGPPAGPDALGGAPAGTAAGPAAGASAGPPQEPPPDAAGESTAGSESIPGSAGDRLPVRAEPRSYGAPYPYDGPGFFGVPEAADQPAGFGPGPGGPAPAGAADGGYPRPPGGAAPGGRPPGSGNGARLVAVLVGAVVLLAVVVGGVVWLGSGYDKETPGTMHGGRSSPGTAPSASAGVPDGGAAQQAGGSSDSADPGQARMPYVELGAGTCFDSPGLDSSVKVVATVACTGPHDGEIIGDAYLSGPMGSAADLRKAALALCAPQAKARLASLPKDGRTYYNYAFYPDLATYQRGRDVVSCSLTLSNREDGPKLTAPLPG